MHVRIFQPSRAATQAGRARAQGWVIEPELETPRLPEPLMGWASAGDTLNQIKLRFQSKEDAIAFAERKGWTYSVAEPQTRRIPPKNYGDNFRRGRPA